MSGIGRSVGVAAGCERAVLGQLVETLPPVSILSIAEEIRHSLDSERAALVEGRARGALFDLQSALREHYAATKEYHAVLVRYPRIREELREKVYAATALLSAVENYSQFLGNQPARRGRKKAVRAYEIVQERWLRAQELFAEGKKQSEKLKLRSKQAIQGVELWLFRSFSAMPLGGNEIGSVVGAKMQLAKVLRVISMEDQQHVEALVERAMGKGEQLLAGAAVARSVAKGIKQRAVALRSRRKSTLNRITHRVNHHFQRCGDCRGEVSALSESEKASLLYLLHMNSLKNRWTTDFLTRYAQVEIGDVIQEMKGLRLEEECTHDKELEIGLSLSLARVLREDIRFTREEVMFRSLWKRLVIPHVEKRRSTLSQSQQERVHKVLACASPEPLISAELHAMRLGWVYDPKEAPIQIDPLQPEDVVKREEWLAHVSARRHRIDPNCRPNSG